MSKKTKLLLCVIGIFLVTSILIGISYAYYIFSVSQSGSNVVRTDCFEITYTDGNAINISDTIPLTDKEAKELDPYTFTIKNICNQAVDYNVNIETLEGSTMDLDAVATKLDGKKKQILGSIEDNSNLVNSNATSSKTIYSNILKAGEEKTHNLRLWVDEDATLEQSMSKSYSSKVVVSGVLHPNYSESTLISGPLLNKAFKQLAGTEPTQEDIDSFNNMINSEEFDPSLYSVDYNIYNNLDDQNVHHIIVTDQHPGDGITTSVISSSDSSEGVLAWFDTDTIYIYSGSNKIYLNEDLSFMFSGLSSLTNLDVSDFDTTNVTDMTAMFSELSSLTNLDVSDFDTTNVTDMTAMFYGMSGLTNLDVSNFDTSNVTKMSYMFYGMSSVSKIYVGNNWSLNNVSKSVDMFYNCSNLVGGSGTIYSPAHQDALYAVIGCGTTHPGYLTYKGPIGDNAAYCASIGYDYSSNAQ